MLVRAGRPQGSPRRGAEFYSGKKAHPAFIVDNLQTLVTQLELAGYRTVEDEPLQGYHRRFVNDPFGNRIELMEQIAAEPPAP